MYGKKYFNSDFSYNYYNLNYVEYITWNFKN